MKKIGLLVMALVMALGSLGIGYAKWSDSVSLSKSVSTGNVCVQWQTISETDDCPTGPPWYVGPGEGDPNLDLSVYPELVTYVKTDKNVACTAVQKLDSHTLLVTVTNAYPLYYGDVEVEWCNCGTIPVKLQNVKIEGVGFELSTEAWNDDPETCKPLWVEMVDGVGTQVEPTSAIPLPAGKVKCIASSVKWVVQQCAAQGATYQFRITWDVVQWNEYVAP